MNDDTTLSQIKHVLSFSQAEIISALFLLVGTVFYIVISIFNTNEYLQQSYDVFQNTSPVYANYQQVSAQINSNQHVANATIFMVWAITGLLAFYMVLVLIGSEKGIAELIRMLMKGGETMRLALEERLVQYAIRISAIIMLLLLTDQFVKSLLPLLVVWAQVTPYKTAGDYILTALGIWAVLCVVIHLVIILIRCVALRQRLVITS